MKAREKKIHHVTIEEFNKVLEEMDYRYKKPYNPADSNEELGSNLYLWYDKRNQPHLLVKKPIYNEKLKKYKNEILHLVVDPFNPHIAKSDDLYMPGANAFKKAKKLCDKYGDDLNYINNDYYDAFYKTDQFDFNNLDYQKEWYKAVDFDMNNCYPSFFKNPLPYGEIIGYNRIVRAGEIGFDEVMIKDEMGIVLHTSPVSKASIIFKSKIYQGLIEYASNSYTNLRKLDHESDERLRLKAYTHAFLGNMKHHNIFIRAAVLGYARAFMEKIKFEYRKYIITMTVDSIVTVRPDLIEPLLPMGEEMGQFKIEYNGYYCRLGPGIVAWANDTIKYKSKSLNQFDDNWNMYLEPKCSIDYVKFRLVEHKDERRKIAVFPPFNEEEAINRTTNIIKEIENGNKEKEEDLF